MRLKVYIETQATRLVLLLVMFLYFGLISAFVLALLKLAFGSLGIPPLGWLAAASSMGLFFTYLRIKF